MAVYLQTLVKKGGYGFTPLQNAAFTVSSWTGVLAAQLLGMLVHDRIPLWLCRRRGFIWKPEYRLATLFRPSMFLLPIGLGRFRAALKYKLHFVVLAFSKFIITFCHNLVFPVTINYVVENFTGHASEVTGIIGFYRIVLGLLVPFFIDGWQAKVGVGWSFGGFFVLFGFMVMTTVAWKGPTIREHSFQRF